MESLDHGGGVLRGAPDHARLTRRDKAIIKTKEIDEHLVTGAMIELASELEGEAGFPIYLSEPSAARNEERRTERLGGRAREGEDDELGEDSPDEGEMPLELQQVANEAFGMHFKAKQKIAEVKKLRQYYRRPDAEEKKKALAAQMKSNPHLRPVRALVEGMPLERASHAGDNHAEHYLLHLAQGASGVGREDELPGYGICSRGGRGQSVAVVGRSVQVVSEPCFDGQWMP